MSGIESEKYPPTGALVGGFAFSLPFLWMAIQPDMEPLARLGTIAILMLWSFVMGRLR